MEGEGDGGREGGGADGGIVKQERDNEGEPCFFGWEPLARRRQKGGFLDEVSALPLSVTTPSLPPLLSSPPSFPPSASAEPRSTISPSNTRSAFGFLCPYSLLLEVFFIYIVNKQKQLISLSLSVSETFKIIVSY